MTLTAILSLCDRNEVATLPLLLDNYIGDALVIEAEMPLHLLERRIDDRIFNDDLFRH